ncbi:BRMS1 [Lepeophtheirus salmonis]|uniref:BRMS1 n=1 Tax=Lepeophtheirus salmonis TaxID=72036 RepID=D3PK06_LEPSM|nr:breast cancer metastasis-suppressor 1-like protein-A [Lepeophtheirus salmonis]ADD38892.1 Breast cancer metastasis-suppressor 1-like protein [Lepeophtheirus salmonis]CAB4067880.1 BRMS1 [Lepeophtheirus salmonis]CAF2997463.1 BRMS1 [Lepeophtheirus salmonis]
MTPKSLRSGNTGQSGSDEMEESGLSGNESGVVDSSDDGEEVDEEEDEEEEDSEDSSDMDVQECEKKRYEFIDDLTDLEKQFAILREQLYRERMTQIETKLVEVKSGKASEYLQPLEELQDNMKNRMEVGAILRDLRLENINCKFDAEKIATHQNFMSEKNLLWDSIKAELEEKIHLLEEDKNNLDLSSGLWDDSGKGCRRKMDPDNRKKPVSVTGPYIVYMLHENDILDDWTLIKKAISQRKLKTECK